MALLLHIDTSTDLAGICLSEDETILSYSENKQQRDHASWIQPAIRQLMNDNARTLHQLNGIGVTSGPGSYTGLRVGFSTAKGLCYALQIPLITINTLEAMASAVSPEPNVLVCPMIDARRLEVFTAIYDNELREVLKPVAMQVDFDAFDEYLHNHQVIFFGNGAPKLKDRIRHVNARFEDIHFTACHMAQLISKKNNLKLYADLPYSEPEYFKEFYTSSLNKTV